MTAENFTKITNDYKEAQAKITIPGRARQILDVIERRTFGYHSNTVFLRDCEIVKATGIPRQNIQRSRDKLIALGLIVVIKRDYKVGLSYNLITDPEKWKVLSPAITKPKKSSPVITPVIASDDKCNQGRLHPIHIKETLKKDSKESKPPAPKKKPKKASGLKIPEILLSKTFAVFWSLYPNKAGSKKTAWTSWKRIAPDNRLAAKIFASVMNHATHLWRRAESGPATRFIPHATTWLNQERWHAVIEVDPAEGLTGDVMWHTKSFCWMGCPKVIPGKLPPCHPSDDCRQMFCSKGDIDQMIADKKETERGNT